MWSRLYRNHVIMAFPTYNTVTNAWAPQADINWFAGSSHDSKFVQFSKRCTTEEEAVTWVLRRSEVWVDNRLQRLSRAILPERGRGIDMIEAAKSHLGKVTPKQPVRPRFVWSEDVAAANRHSTIRRKLWHLLHGRYKTVSRLF
jgi:hypothetical protein